MDKIKNEKIVFDVINEFNNNTNFIEVFILDLDALFQDSYEGGCYPENDLEGRGHYGTCYLKDKELYKKRFLLEMAKRFEIYGKIEKRIKSD